MSYSVGGLAGALVLGNVYDLFGRNATIAVLIAAMVVASGFAISLNEEE